MVKKSFDTELSPEDYQNARKIIKEAAAQNVTKIINVATSYQESLNCINLARQFDAVYATIGIHPNDLTDQWQHELILLEKYIPHTEFKIVGIGETGLDTHYPDYNLSLQKEAFKRQIELALKHNLALVVHTRDAADDTLRCLEEFKDSKLRGTIHCFSNDLIFAQDAINLGFMLGIGGTCTYPKNTELRSVITALDLDHIILETDAPFLPIQKMRGKQNHPAFIYDIAHYIAQLRNQSFDQIAHITTQNALTLFNITL